LRISMVANSDSVRSTTESRQHFGYFGRRVHKIDLPSEFINGESPGSLMSYSFREPEWPAFCECKYDEARDEMDREDCPFHCDRVSGDKKVRPVMRKKPIRAADVNRIRVARETPR